VGLLLLAPVHAHDDGTWETDCGICSLAKVCPIPTAELALPLPVRGRILSTDVRAVSAPCSLQRTPFAPRAPPAILI
ncbi:MAG: hypothetical protein KDI31_13710, partial [Pseudomonadales bacterium]|nr:hypothetical protein [Pseudomonadales bacterium]